MINYRIHFISNGEPENDGKQLFLGRQDVPLSAAGRKELLCLKDQFLYPSVDIVYTSPLLRCRETAQILYPDRHCIVQEGLTEMDMGVLTHKTARQLEHNVHFKNWIEKGLSYAIPGGEGGQDYSRRCIMAFGRLFEHMTHQKMQSAAVVTHPGVILYLLSAMGVPKLDFSQSMIKNGTGYTVLVSAQMWMRSQSFEIYAHLPFEKYSEAEIAALREEQNYEKLILDVDKSAKKD